MCDFTLLEAVQRFGWKHVKERLCRKVYQYWDVYQLGLVRLLEVTLD